MKTAIYIEDGVVQLVVTPESQFEKNALSSFEGKGLSVEIFTGSFYDCRGGWTKQKEHDQRVYHDFRDDRKDKSIILRVEENNSDDQQQGKISG